MSFYSLQHRLIFIHIPKNAGSATNSLFSATLQDYRGFEDLNKDLGHPRDMALGNHFTYRMMASLIDQHGIDLDYHNFLKVCIVRNPWARMVSLFDHRIRKMHLTFEGRPRNSPEDIELLSKGFKPWLLKTNNVSDKVLTKMQQLEWIKDDNGNLVADVVMTHESIQPDIDQLMERLGLPRSELPRVNFSQNDTSRYAERYDDETRDFIAHHFADDITTFGYTFGG